MCKRNSYKASIILLNLNIPSYNQISLKELTLHNSTQFSRFHAMYIYTLQLLFKQVSKIMA